MREQNANRHVKNLPHHNVYAQLRPSRIHGVGVFAIRRIKKGTSIFPDDQADIKWVKRSEIGRVPPEIWRLYEDFSIIKDDGESYGCPSSFNQLTLAWFLNSPWHPQKPNVGCRDEYMFFALRDIKAGEELTVDYRTFSEEPPARRKRKS